MLLACGMDSRSRIGREGRLRFLRVWSELTSEMVRCVIYPLNCRVVQYSTSQPTSPTHTITSGNIERSQMQTRFLADSIRVIATINANDFVSDIVRLHHPQHRLSNLLRSPKPPNWYSYKLIVSTRYMEQDVPIRSSTHSPQSASAPPHPAHRPSYSSLQSTPAQPR